MYLATLNNGTVPTFEIRQSYRKPQENCFSFRVVYDLGPDPRQFFTLFNDHIVLFDNKLLTAISAASQTDGESLIEKLLWQFLPEETRRRLLLFEARAAGRPRPLSEQEREEITSLVHIFDRRRLYYLRYGAVDQSRLSRLHEKCCRPLLGKSRDEREYLFAAEESVLSPGLYLQYVYAIFNVQKHFHQSFAPWFPEALAQDEVADHFISELCRLSNDDQFWQGEELCEDLHPHLRRYLIMFFDHSPAGRSFQGDFARAFMAGHRQFRWPKRSPGQSPEKISAIFGTPYEQLKKMSAAELTRLYRKKAMQLHPDRGGDHDLFIELTAVYDALLHLKK